MDLRHDWRIEDLPYARSDDGGATANPSTFAFETRPSPDGEPPQAIGPFDVNADHLRYHHEQGLSSRQWKIEDVFTPELLDT